jgi:NitT/TauT family transport system substrate-binding protein
MRRERASATCRSSLNAFSKPVVQRARTLRILAAGALAAAAPSLRARAAGATIRFLTVHSEQGASAIYADREGFFERAGLDVQLELLANGATVLSAVVGGAAELGVANPVSLAVAHQHGAPVVAFAPTAYYNGASLTSLLLVARDSPIRSAADLNGKTVGVNGLKNTPQFATEEWIARGGGDPQSVKFIEMPYDAMPTALAQGRVDAAYCAEPALSAARKTTRVLGDPYRAVAPQFLTGVYITTTGYADANPEIVARVAAALHDTAVWANAHPAETAATLAAVTKIDLAVVRSMARSRYAERLTPEDLQPPIDLAAKYGLLSGTIPARELIWSRANTR